jgi:ABC-2 type transport system ATP-binding protein
VLEVEVVDEADRLAERLAGDGLTVRLDRRTVFVAFDGEGTYDRVRDAVVELGLGLDRLEQGRHRLEDLFRDEPEAAPLAAGERR